MRFLVALLLLAAASFVAVPTAAACHPEPAAATTSAPGYYVVPDAGYGGCPHELTVCLQVWRESNGQPGLQTWGEDPDTLIVLVCPYP